MKMELSSSDQALIKAVQARVLYGGFGDPEVIHSSGVVTIAVEDDEFKREDFQATVVQLDPGARPVP